MGLFKKGNTPWNKGTKGLANGYWKGKKLSKNHRDKLSESHKGQIAWNKGLKGFMADSKHSLWKGDKVGYGALHDWLKRKYGLANKCENPNCPGKSKRYTWANVGGKYLRKRKDFIMLCYSCHKKYDLKRKLLTGNCGCD